MSTQSQVLKFLRAIDSGKYTRSYVEQYCEEEGLYEVLEILEEIWDRPEIGEQQ